MNYGTKQHKTRFFCYNTVNDRTIMLDLFTWQQALSRHAMMCKFDEVRIEIMKPLWEVKYAIR
jgi:predicted transcriptional regulator